MKANDLEKMGFVQISETEFSDDVIIISLLNDNIISIISKNIEEDFYSIPLVKCKNTIELLEFFDKIFYTIKK